MVVSFVKGKDGVVKCIGCEDLDGFGVIYDLLVLMVEV